MGRVLRASMGIQTIALEDRKLQVVDGPPDPAGGSRPSPLPSAHGGDSSQPKSSPAIPAAVGVSIVILAALITWRCLVFFRHPRRAAVLDRFGFIRRPRMFEVHPILVPHKCSDGRMLSSLVPLSVVEVPLKSNATRPVPRSTFGSGAQSASTHWHLVEHGRLRAHSQARAHRMVDHSDRSGAASRGLPLQVAVLVAMPMEGRRKPTQLPSNISDEFAGVHIGIMHAVCPTSQLIPTW